MNKFHGEIQTIVYRYLYDGVISELLKYSDSSYLQTVCNRFKVTSKGRLVTHPCLAIRKCENGCGQYTIINTYTYIFRGVDGMCWECTSKKSEEEYKKARELKRKQQLTKLRLYHIKSWLKITTLGLGLGVFSTLIYEYLRGLEYTDLNIICKTAFITYCWTGTFTFYKYYTCRYLLL